MPSARSLSPEKRTARNGVCRLEFGMIAVAIAFLMLLTSTYPTSYVSRSSVYLTGQAIQDMQFFQERHSDVPLLEPEDEDDDVSISDDSSSAWQSRIMEDDYETEDPGAEAEEWEDREENRATQEDGDADLIEDNLPRPPPFPPDKVASNATVFGTFSGVGTYSKRYFRFQNVQLTDNNTLTFYMPPGMRKQSRHSVDIIINNSSSTNPSLPSRIMVRAGITHEYNYLNIRYVDAQEEQPKCTKWEHRPTYLLTMQHNENIWHAWNDGLLGAFQTLREQGVLPLAKVDAQGNMQEYIDDLPEDCPRVIDLDALDRGKQLVKKGFNASELSPEERGQAFIPPREHCRPRRGSVPPGSRCDPDKEVWCREGVVAADRTQNAPVLLPYKGTAVVRRWGHLFEALSSEILNWDGSVGTCFSEIYIGKSNALQFYMPLKMGGPTTNVTMLRAAETFRSNATEAVKLFMLTAERTHRAWRHIRKPHMRHWPGYEDPDTEKLRQGVGPEDIKLLDVLTPTKDQALTLGEMTEAEWKEIEGLLEQSAAKLESVVKNAGERKAQQEEKENGSSDSAPKERSFDFSIEKPRPVVTYMWRPGFKRSTLNPHIILKYILLRYNVTVRVTTFQEPVLESMDLMGHTDLLLGMHGAGWTNGLFIKRGAATLQFLPYGWMLEDGKAIRGMAYQSLLLARDVVYSEWGNTRADYAFMRRWDFRNYPDVDYALHPQRSWGLPTDKRPGNYWVYQNTFADIESLAPQIDKMMVSIGIKPIK